MKYVVFLIGVFCTLVSYGEDLELAEINLTYQKLLDDYARVGEKHSLAANLINFASIRKDPRLVQLTFNIQNYPKLRLDTKQKNLAFYLNAYNILSIAKVAKHWPIKKLKSLGTFLKPVWTHDVGAVCGEQMTLRKLEHEVLRKLGEPRIHFALNCASMSCPDIRLEPYLAEAIDQQLADQVKIFMSQKGKGMLIKGDGKVKLSPIFKWFAEDFDSVGGVGAFILPYLPKRGLPTGDTPWEIVGYLNYDWSVNAHLNSAEKKKINRRAKSNHHRH